MSRFTYHIPHNAVYTMEDMLHVLNNEKVHSVLARENNFYSLGSFSESIFAPISALVGGVAAAFAPIAFVPKEVSLWTFNPAEIYAGLWALNWLAVTAYIALPWLKNEIFDNTLAEVKITTEVKDLVVNNQYTVELTTSSNKWYYYQDPSDTSQKTDYFTAKEMCYMLNTNDIISTLKHEVPDDYEAPINHIGDWSSIAVIDM